MRFSEKVSLVDLKHLVIVLLGLVLWVRPLHADDWKNTISEVRRSVLSLKVNSSRAFDDKWNSSSVATGFVVDAKQGIVLTNRHVITVGPVDARGVFSNGEEISLTPIYRDPVHDFGFLKYDPQKLKFNSPKSLVLRPEAVERGLEVRVIGNDSGENFSILPGILALLDREAPQYGFGRYSDFNTFYIQSASMTSGGSSGSPVIDREGRVVALNAGGRRGAASAYFLPLDRVKRALELLREKKPVVRGTLHTQFRRISLGELSMLGVPKEVQAEILEMYPDASGMLGVGGVLPGTSSFKVLRAGDVIVKINGQIVIDYVRLEDILDGSVDKEVVLAVIRGGKRLDIKVSVSDLTQLVPDDFVEVGSTIFHPLSYNLAWHFNRAPRGIYVADPGYLFNSGEIPKGSLVTKVQGHPISNLDEIERVLKDLPQGATVSVEYVNLAYPNVLRQGSLTLNAAWFPAQRCKREGYEERWNCVDIKLKEQREFPKPQSVSFLGEDSEVLNKLASAFVYVNYTVPYSVSGYDVGAGAHFEGAGIIVDKQQGLVITDRNTVLHAVGDVTLTFAGSISIPARLEYLHPVHNLAILSFDPRLLADTPITEVSLSDKEVKSRDKLLLVDMGAFGAMHLREVTVESVSPLSPWVTKSLFFHETNIDLIRLEDYGSLFNGVLVDSDGSVLALWGSFAYKKGERMEQLFSGLPAYYLRESLRHVKSGSMFTSLELETFPTSIAVARQFGVPDQELRNLAELTSNGRRQVLRIEQLAAGSPSARVLSPGDFILAVDGKAVVSNLQLEQLVQGRESVEMKVWSSGEIKIHTLPTVALKGIEVDRLVVWNGAVFQEPHRALATRGQVPREGLYVSYSFFGSPAVRDGLTAGFLLVEFDNIPITSLTQLEGLIRSSKPGDVFQIRLKDLRGAERLVTVRQDRDLWPGYSLRRNAGYDWSRETLTEKHTKH